MRDYIYFSSAEKLALTQSFTAHMQTIQQAAYEHVFSATGNHAFALFDSYIIAWFPTPGSYLVTFTIALGSFLISVAIQRTFKIPYWKTLFSIGFVLFLANAVLLPVSNILPLLYIAPVSILWALLFFSIPAISKKIRSRKIKSSTRD